MPTVKLKEVLNKKGVSFQELASKVEIPIETLRNIYYERVRDPKVSTVMEISRVLDCSVNYLMGEEFINDTEHELVEHFRKCGNHGKALLLMMAKFEAAKTKQERLDALMTLQSGISLEFNQSRVGSEIKVIVDDFNDGVFVCRSEFESPEVDGEILVKYDSSLEVDPYSLIGEFITVKVVGADEYDLIAEIVEI